MVTARNPAELVHLVTMLQEQVAELQRQVAPFSNEARVAAPKRPGRKPGHGAVAGVTGGSGGRDRMMAAADAVRVIMRGGTYPWRRMTRRSPKPPPVMPG
jgi:hypothetical protein